MLTSCRRMISNNVCIFQVSVVNSAMYQSPVQVLTGLKKRLDRAVFVFESSLMDALDKVACDPATEFKSEVVEPTC